MVEKIKLSDTFSYNIKKLRDKRGWTQAELARQTNLTSAAINQLEKGTRSPTLKVSTKIAGALGTDVSELFNENESRSPDLVLDFYRKFKVLESLSGEDQELILNMANKLSMKRTDDV